MTKKPNLIFKHEDSFGDELSLRALTTFLAVRIVTAEGVAVVVLDRDTAPQFKQAVDEACKRIDV